MEGILVLKLFIDQKIYPENYWSKIRKNSTSSTFFTFLLLFCVVYLFSQRSHLDVLIMVTLKFPKVVLEYIFTLSMCKHY